MTETEMKIVNAIALEPGKVYILEVDRAKISSELLHHILNYLDKQGIKGAAIRSIGGAGLRIVEPEKETTDGPASVR